MKTSIFLKAALVAGCITPPPLSTAWVLQTTQAQTVPPIALEWDRWDAPAFRSSGLVFEWSGTAWTSDEEPSTSATAEDSGADWWNDLTVVRDEFGEPIGYAAAGWVGWSNWAPPEQGCFPASPAPSWDALPTHLVTTDIQRGHIRSAIGFYDLDGELLWIKAYHAGGLFGIIQDSNGDLVVCGHITGNDNAANFDDMTGVPPLLYNPAIGEPVVELDDADCEAVSAATRLQMMLMKLDIDGTVLWNHCFNWPGSVDTGIKTRASGYALVETERDAALGYRVVGTAASSLNDGWRPFMVQTDDDGMLLWSEHLTAGPSSLWTSTVSGNNQIMFNAIDRHVDPLDGTEYFAVTGMRSLGSVTSSFLFYYEETTLDNAYVAPEWARDVVADNSVFAEHSTTLKHRSTDVIFHTVNGEVGIAWPIVANIQGSWFAGSHYAEGIIHMIDPNDPDQIIASRNIGELHAFDLYMGVTSLSDGNIAVATSKWPEGRTIAGTKFGWSDLAASQECLEEFNGTTNYWNPSSGNGPGNVYWFYGSQSYAAILFGTDLSIMQEHQWIHGGGYETLPLDCRLGNPRQRQCNFNLVEAPDGGLVVVGNTGHNFDDAYLAKLNYCYALADFADLPLTDGEHLIEGPTPVVWDENMDVRGSIVVDDGATLIIDGATIGFAPTTPQLVTNLKVMPGGRLELINEAKLTTVSNCGENTVWDGVIVLGDATASQLPATAPVAQGYIEIRDGSTIEHAITGIFVGDPNDLTVGGGVVNMKGTEADPPGTISNCKTGIFFRPYQFHPYPTTVPGLVSNNQSVFQYARFTTDDFTRFSNDFIAEGHHAHVVLDEAIGRVIFSACLFENEKAYDQSHLLGHGIKAIDSRITVRDACPAPPSGCTVGQRIPTTFRGLDHGVHALDGAAASSYSIVGSHFANNICGVYASQSSYLRVSNNTFELGGRDASMTNVLEQNWDEHHRGIYVTGGNALRIMDNELWMDEEPNAEAEGIVVGYTYDANEVVRGNTATGIKRAFVGEGFAANLNTPDQAGLQFLCNTNTENPTNFTSRKATGGDPSIEAFHTIRTTQGSPLRATGNVFDATSGYWDYDVKTTVLPIKYHHWVSGGQEPEYYSDGTVDGELQPLVVGPLLPTACGPLVVVDNNNPAQLVIVLDSIIVVRDSVRSALKGLVDNGSTETLLDELAYLDVDDSTALYTGALLLSPYISVQVLRAIVDSDILSKDKLTDVLVANPEATRYQNFSNWLGTGAAVEVSPSVIEAVRASWEYPSPRWDIEVELGELQGMASEVAHALLDYYLADSLEVDSDSLQWVLERIPASGAIYSQALLMAKDADFSAAYSVMTNAPLPDGDGFLLGTDEPSMVLGLIGALEMLHGEERTVRDLDSAEVASTLEGLDLYHDRAWSRISNVFCFHYGHCRPTLTGDAVTAPKMLLHPEKEEPNTTATFRLYPNPTRDQVTVDYQFQAPHVQTFVHLRDLSGRELGLRSMPGAQGRLILDVSNLAPGLYVLDVRCEGRTVHVEKFLVQQ